MGDFRLILGGKKHANKFLAKTSYIEKNIAHDV